MMTNCQTQGEEKRQHVQTSTCLFDRWSVLVAQINPISLEMQVACWFNSGAFCVCVIFVKNLFATVSITHIN